MNFLLQPPSLLLCENVFIYLGYIFKDEKLGESWYEVFTLANGLQPH